MQKESRFDRMLSNLTKEDYNNMESLRKLYKAVEKQIYTLNITPREKALALTKLEESSMWANKGYCEFLDEDIYGVNKMTKENENNYFGGYTREQYHNQNFNWEDNCYDYAIDITDGGAIYLMQKDIAFDREYEMRLDGVDLVELIKVLQRLKEKNNGN